MTRCLLGLGSNMGDRANHLLSAVAALREHPAIRVERLSSLVETAPVGGPAGQGRYLNAAAVIETALPAAELLEVLMSVERRFGRERGGCWGPRTIDLDLLLYGDEQHTGPGLVVPHPRLHERRFVLAPAAQIAGDLVHPGLGETIESLLARLPPATQEEVGLQVVTSAEQLQHQILSLRRQGSRVGLVPTMGALHEGHLSLVQAARQEADVVAATIFVNPTQFAPHEDFGKYPRTLEADLQALSAAGCALVFVPDRDEMYPPGMSTFVEPPAVAQPFEGVCRPGHFRGVATIVLKLFHVAPADVACFGQKDFQQALVVRRMVADLNVPIAIRVCPTVREPDGLALSSRNRYLSPSERRQALALSQALVEARQLIARGERAASKITAAMRNRLLAAGVERIDYAAVADPETLVEQTSITGPVVALIACYVGRTRLIDNEVIRVPRG